MGGHHKAKNWGCPDTVDTNGSSPMVVAPSQNIWRWSYGPKTTLILDLNFRPFNRQHAEAR